MHEPDFVGNVPAADQEIVEETKATGAPASSVTDEQRRRMDQNVIEYEKKLSDFERMFLFVNDDLDFQKLS